MQLEGPQVKIIMNKGVNKAKSLVAFHISGNLLNAETVIYIKETLKIINDDRKENATIDNCHQVLS